MAVIKEKVMIRRFSFLAASLVILASVAVAPAGRSEKSWAVSHGSAAG
jgi:hypothetical protein